MVCLAVLTNYLFLQDEKTILLIKTNENGFRHGLWLLDTEFAGILSFSADSLDQDKIESKMTLKFYMELYMCASFLGIYM